MSYTNKTIEAFYEQLVETEQRATQTKNFSKQKPNVDAAFQTLFNWQSEILSDRQKYKYSPDARKRDAWLATVWKKEPHLAGVLNSVIAIDKNRNWTLTGTKRQVTLYNNILRHADDNAGWREFVSVNAMNFYTADLGAVTEIGRQGRIGPMRGVYNVDPTKLKLTGDRNFPFEYYPDNGQKSSKWAWFDAFRLMSMPSAQDKYHRLGFSAISRAIEVVSLLIAVYEYDQEMLLAKAPKGLLLLQNIGEQQWEDALAMRKEKMGTMGQEYFSGVMVLAQEGMDQMDAKLIGLSQLPSGFDRETMINQVMYAYSLIFGYPPDEFWPVQYGALGRGRETEIGYLRSLSKGGSDYALGLQDRMQQELPETLLFEFESRNPEADLANANIHLAWARAIDMYVNGVKGDGSGVLTAEEGRGMLAVNGLIDPNLTEQVEATVAEIAGTERAVQDKRPLRTRQEEYRENLFVMRAADLFPREPIIRVHYPSNRAEILFDRGEDLYVRTLWATTEMVVLPKNQLTLEQRRALTRNGASAIEPSQEDPRPTDHDLREVPEGIPNEGEPVL